MSTHSLADSSTYAPSNVIIPGLESIYVSPEAAEVRSATRFSGKKVDVGSVEWTARQLWTSKPEVAIGILDIWANSRRRHEVSVETIAELNSLDDEQVVEALNELQGRKRYIRGSGNQMDIAVVIKTLDNQMRFKLSALLDSGCTGSCINASFVKHNKINTKKYPRPIPVYNADGSLNSGGSITEYVELLLEIGQHVEILQFAVSNLGKTEIFIGHEWLKLHNPSIDWAKSTLKFDRCPVRCEPLGGWEDPESDDPESEDPEIEEGDRILMVDMHREIQIRTFQTKSSKVSEQQSKKGPSKTFEEAVPGKYHDFKDLFDKENFDEMPPSRPWDHAIELLPNTKNLDCKIYPLSPDEQKQLDEFLDENLRTGRIRPSK